METVTKVLYEAMFLVDSAEAASDWEGINQLISGLLEKFGAQIVSIHKWDESRLAYEVNGKSRGTYILCYFRSEGAKIQEIERAVQLSERIMRVLILNAENMRQEDIDKATPAALAVERAEAAAAASEEQEQEVAPEIKEDLDVEELVVVNAIESDIPAAKPESGEESKTEQQEVTPEIKEGLDVEESVVVDAIESDIPAAKPESEEESETEQQEEE